MVLMAGLQSTPIVSCEAAALHRPSFQHSSSFAITTPISSLLKSCRLRSAPTNWVPRCGIVPHYLIESKAAEAEPPGQQLFQLQKRQSRFFHQLPSGLKMEIIEHLAYAGVKESKPTLLFLHGSYHAAWCWAIHWLPFFASQGYDCFALSFLGQGQSDTPPSRVGGTLQSHARDVAHFIQSKISKPPVLVGHSFGGLIVQQYLAHVAEPPSSARLEGLVEPYPVLAGAVLACSVPPTGNGPLVQRYLRSKPIASIKVTLSFAAKLFAYNESLCRETFFSASIPSSLVQVYQKLLAKSSNVPLFNLRELNASLPVGHPGENAPPILVVGAENDFVVDMQGLQETAAIYGNRLVVLPSMAHDIMLDTAWEDAAKEVHSWLKENCCG